MYLYLVKHSEVKNRIVETASALFYKQGYNSTGINEIIEKSGIAKATLYNHFKSKDDLCLAYLQLKNTTFLEDISTYCAAKEEGKARVLAIFDFLQLFFKDKDFNGCWCIKTVSEIPQDNEVIRKEIQRQKTLFIDVIKELVNDNLKNTQTDLGTEALAKQIYLLYEGAVGESHLHQEDWPIKQARQICAQIIA